MKDHPNLMTSETELFNVPKALQNPIKKAVFIKFFVQSLGVLQAMKICWILIVFGWVGLIESKAIDGGNAAALYQLVSTPPPNPPFHLTSIGYLLKLRSLLLELQSNLISHQSPKYLEHHHTSLNLRIMG